MHYQQYRPARSTDEDEHEADDEKEARKTPFLRTKHFVGGLTTCSSILLALVFAILLGAAYLYGTAQSPGSSQRRDGFVPFIPFTKRPVIFSEDKRWAHSDPGADALWKELGANGFTHSIVIQNPRIYNLKPGATWINGTERFGLSMYHQLHCLASIRASFYNASSPVHHEHTRIQSRSEPHHFEHIDHCFDYLRQSIECSADLTIEWVRRSGESRGEEVDGWSIPHYQCKDPEAIEDFLHENQ